MKNFEIEQLKVSYATHKQVKYFTSRLTVPDYVTYIATDFNGIVFGYSDKPVLSAGGYHWTYSTPTLGIVEIGTIKYRGDWKESLKKV